MNWFRRILNNASTRAVSWWSDKFSWGGLVSVGQMSNAGVLVTPDRALGLSAYYAAINRISTDVASLPLRVYRRKAKGGREEVRDHPVSELLAHSPDGETTSMRWRQAMMAHTLGWGNGYAEVTTDGKGYPTGLYLLDPARTSAQRRANDHRLYYRISHPPASNRKDSTLPPYKVIHCAGLGYDGLQGYSIATYARESIGVGLGADKSSGSFFGNGSRPSGALELPYKLPSKPAADLLRQSWNEQYSGVDNVGKVVVLENGAKFSPIAIPPDDAQLLQTRQFQVIEIARWFGLPPHKIGDYSSTGSAYRALEEANTDYLLTTIAPWCEAVEQELNLKLLTADERRGGFFIKHNLASIARGNMQARGEFYTKMVGLSVMCPDDVAELEGFNPTGEFGGERYVSTALTPVELALEPPAPPPAPVAAPPDPGKTPPEPGDETVEGGDVGSTNV